MKKITFLWLVTILFVGMSDWAMAQSQQIATDEPVPSLKSGSKKYLRQYRRAQRSTLQSISMDKILQSKNFIYYPSQFDYALGYSYQNVQLTSYYYVEVTPSQLIVQLPIFGAGRYSSQPSFWRELNFFTSNYTYQIEPGTGGGWVVTVKAMDTWSFNTFTFVFQVMPGGSAQMSISTPFVGPAYFSGSVYSNN